MAIAAASEMTSMQTTIVDWVNLIRSEYLEIPGLCLTATQVQRFWGLDAVSSDALLDTLVAVRFLKRTPAGAYLRADGGGR
jgi:hypothetical protein